MRKYNLQHWTAAASAYRITRMTWGRHADLAVMEARAREQAGDMKGAFAAYGEAIRLDPKSSDALSRRASLYDARNNGKRAMANPTHAIEVTPADAAMTGQSAIMVRVRGGQFEVRQS